MNIYVLIALISIKVARMMYVSLRTVCSNAFYQRIFKYSSPVFK